MKYLLSLLFCFSLAAWASGPKLNGHFSERELEDSIRSMLNQKYHDAVQNGEYTQDEKTAWYDKFAWEISPDANYPFVSKGNRIAYAVYVYSKPREIEMHLCRSRVYQYNSYSADFDGNLIWEASDFNGRPTISAAAVLHNDDESCEDVSVDRFFFVPYLIEDNTLKLVYYKAKEVAESGLIDMIDPEDYHLGSIRVISDKYGHRYYIIFTSGEKINFLELKIKSAEFVIHRR